MDKRKAVKTRTERGQATLEFIIIVPLFFGLIFLALAAAVTWNSHHLSSALSLEGASRESMRTGDGLRFINAVGNKVTDSTRWTVQIEDSNWYVFKVKRFTVRGNTYIPWAPFGLNWNIPVQGTTFYPDWQFNGD
jgi:hypothetical protein